MTDACATTTQARAWQQPWLSSAKFDGWLIIAPAFITSLVVLLFQSQFANTPELPLWGWVCFVLCVDVAHVYATLFRTYFDKSAREKNGTLLFTIPLLCWLGGCLLYSVPTWATHGVASTDGLLFWRVLAYLAVFHFIRQQYGFMVLYSRRDPVEAKRFAKLDQLMIYMATVYPLLFWHTHLPRHFSWFVDGDFVQSLPEIIAPIGLAIYAVTAIAYLLKESILFKTTGTFNLPRNLIVLGTALSWWVGIITVNSDMSFTMTNVVSHGIPYMALIWMYHRAGSGTDNKGISFDRWKTAVMTFAPAFVAVLVLLAYLEEGFWDGFVWREHLGVFAPFAHLPTVTDAGILALLVPLLALPQSTHYILDGFIWRVKDRSSIWSA